MARIRQGKSVINTSICRLCVEFRYWWWRLNKYILCWCKITFDVGFESGTGKRSICKPCWYIWPFFPWDCASWYIFGDESYLLGFKVEVLGLVPPGLQTSEKCGGRRIWPIIVLTFLLYGGWLSNLWSVDRVIHAL